MARIRPRQIKEGFKNLFGLFSDAVGQSPEQDEFLDSRSIVEATEDRSLFANLQIKSHSEDRDGRHLMVCSCRGTSYFITIGFPEVNMPSSIVAIDTPLGIFMALVLELKIGIKNSVSDYDIKDKVLVPFEDSDNPPKYILDEIMEYFPEISVFRLNDNVDDYEVSLYKFSTILFCKNSGLLRLNIPQHILDIYTSLVNKDFKYLNYDNLWRSISSIDWRYCFVELYRCIEILFNISLAVKLSDEVCSRLSLNNLFQFSYKNLRDYYHEDVALEYLFSLLSPVIISKLQHINQMKNSRGYYRLRNSIVHGKRMEYYKSILKKDNEWQDLIEFSLLAIDELFDLLDEDLKRFDESNLSSNIQ